MALPRVQTETVNAIVAEMDTESDQYDPNWAENMCALIDKHNPIIAKYIMAAGTACGKHAATVGLLIYKMLDMQTEVHDDSA